MMDNQRLRVCPVKQQDAIAFCCRHHHYISTPYTQHIFALGLLQDMRLVAVIAWGRPTNRHMDDGYTLQGYRLATSERIPNAGSMLISRSIKIARLLGYRRAVTYVKTGYPGSQVRAAGGRLMDECVKLRRGLTARRYEWNLQQ